MNLAGSQRKRDDFDRKQDKMKRYLQEVRKKESRPQRIKRTSAGNHKNVMTLTGSQKNN